MNFWNSEDVTRAWMDSPTHRANILRGAFTEIGVATAQGEYEGKPATFVVQLFGAPAKKKGTIAASVPVERKEPVPIMKRASTSTEELFMAVRGVEIGPEAASDSKPVEPQNNPVQNAFSSPRHVTNGMFLFFIGLFGLALILTIWKNIRALPRLWWGGILVIALAGAGIWINQHISLLSSSIV